MNRAARPDTRQQALVSPEISKVLARRGRSIHIVLLQQHRTDQPGDAGLVRKDADDVGAPLDLFSIPARSVNGSFSSS